MSALAAATNASTSSAIFMFVVLLELTRVCCLVGAYARQSDRFDCFGGVLTRAMRPSNLSLLF